MLIRTRLAREPFGLGHPIVSRWYLRGKWPGRWQSTSVENQFLAPAAPTYMALKHPSECFFLFFCRTTKMHLGIVSVQSAQALIDSQVLVVSQVPSTYWPPASLESRA